MTERTEFDWDETVVEHGDDDEENEDEPRTFERGYQA